jgi:CBS domain-containing protein
MNCPSCGHENIDGTDRCENCLAPFRDLDVPRADAAEGLARSVMEDNLGRLETEQTITVVSDTPVIEVVRLMKHANSGCALVVNDGKLAGIFTEHDVLRKMTGPSAHASTTAVKELMTSSPEILNEQDSVAAALNKMSMGRYRHIPVKKSDGSYTVASIKSVLNYISREDW